MTEDILKILVPITSLVAIILPLIINSFQKENKIKKSLYLIELLKTQNELDKLISEQETKDSSPILKGKLEKLYLEINEEINSIEGETKFQFYFAVVAIEILAIFNNVGNQIILEPSYINKIGFFEGILNPPISRIIVILIVFIIASIITLRIGRKMKTKLEDYWKYNFTMLGIYNVVLILSTLVFAVLLTLLDPLIPGF